MGRKVALPSSNDIIYKGDDDFWREDDDEDDFDRHESFHETRSSAVEEGRSKERRMSGVRVSRTH